MIRLRTLGSLELRGSGGEELRAVLAQPRRVALLAYLALAMPHGSQRRDTVLALFWPELDLDRARNALGQAIHFLRRSIGAGAIVNRNGEGLAIDWRKFWCDTAAFEEALDGNRTAEAVALYRGDLLSGFHIDDAPEFERWLDSERARLAARYMKAVETLAAERDAAGDLQGAVMHWRTLAARDPYSSRLTLHLMRALKAAGDPAGALLQARRHENLLREELGIAPDAEVSALVRELQARRSEGTTSRRAQAAVERPRVESAKDATSVDSAGSSGRPRSRRVALLAAAGVVVSAGLGAAVVTTSDSASGDPDFRALYQRGKQAALNRSLVGVQTAAQLHGDSNATLAVIPKDVYVREMYARAQNAEMSRNEVDLAKARDAYERAIARDSLFAPAYAGLAGLYRALGANGFVALGPAMDSGRLMAQRAFVLDSSLSETRTAVAMTLAEAGEFELAERELKQAIKLNSKDARAHYQYSVLLTALGRGEEATREVQRASELGLQNWRGVQAMQRYAHWLVTGERPYLKLPVRERRPSLKLEPGDPWGIARQAEDLAQTGNCTEARSDLARAQRLAPDNVKMRPFMARVEWWCGDRPRARALLDDLKRRPDAADMTFEAALMHTFFGEKDSAFAALYRNHWTIIELSQLSASPYVDPLRSDPRLLRLQRRLGVRK